MTLEEAKSESTQFIDQNIPLSGITLNAIIFTSDDLQEFIGELIEHLYYKGVGEAIRDIRDNNTN